MNLKLNRRQEITLFTAVLAAALTGLVWLIFQKQANQAIHLDWLPNSSLMGKGDHSDGIRWISDMIGLPTLTACFTYLLTDPVTGKSRLIGYFCLGFIWGATSWIWGIGITALIMTAIISTGQVVLISLGDLVDKKQKPVMLKIACAGVLGWLSSTGAKYGFATLIGFSVGLIAATVLVTAIIVGIAKEIAPKFQSKQASPQVSAS